MVLNDISGSESSSSGGILGPTGTSLDWMSAELDLHSGREDGSPEFDSSPLWQMIIDNYATALT
eukprot:232262-Amorphochlora_amoeboformis.AAC.1